MPPIMDPTTVGSRFRPVRASVTPIPFNQGNVERRRLPKNFAHRYLVCRLTGNLVVGVAAQTNLSLAPLGLIQKIDVIGDGRKTYFSIPGKDAWFLSNLFHTKAGELRAPAAAVATNPFSCTFILDHQSIGMRVPPDSFLDSRKHEELEIVVTWGAPTDIATAGAMGTLAITNCSLDVEVVQTTVGFEYIQFNRLLTSRRDVIVADNTEFTYEIPRTGTLAGILLRTERDRVLVNDIIQTVGLRVDTNFRIFDNLDYDTFQRENVLAYSLDKFLTAAPNLGEQVDGFVYLDLSEDGMISSCINTLAVNTLEPVLNILVGAGTTRTLDSTFVFYEPIQVG